MEYSTQSYYCKERLCHYAEGFSELVRMLKPEEEQKVFERGDKLESYRKKENIQFIRSNLDEVSKLMTQLSADILLPKAMERRKFLYLRKAFRSEGLILSEAQTVARGGKEDLTLCLSTKKGAPIDSAHVANMLSVLLDREYSCSIDNPGFVTGNAQPYLFLEQANYLAFTGYARATKDMETISGDSYSFLDTGDGMFYALLSDGTGSGEIAANESNWVLDLMEKFLEIKYPIEGALRLINGIWTMQQDKWKNPTLDCCSMNLNEGKCEFYKVGASMSYIKHERVVELAEGSCLPLGCFGDMEITKGCYNLEPGDTLIMITDGVLGGFLSAGQENELCELIEKMDSVNPREMAQKVLQSAIFQGKGKICDDMTVLAVRIESRALT